VKKQTIAVRLFLFVVHYPTEGSFVAGVIATTRLKAQRRAEGMWGKKNVSTPRPNEHLLPIEGVLLA
jgi:hypothetical protein